MYVNAEVYGNRKVLRVDPNNLSQSSNDVVLPILLNGPLIFNHLISLGVPKNVCHNSIFLVDLDKMEDPLDISCDDLGSWEQSRTSTKSYIVQRNKTGHVSSISIKKDHDILSDEYIVTRRPYTNKSDRTVKKTLVSVTLPDKIPYNIVYICYKFNEQEGKIKVKPHGNSKINIPYLRTYPSTSGVLPSRVQDKLLLKLGD